MTSHTNNDEYATYIKSLMESVWSYDTSADETRDFEVNMIDDAYFASVKMTGTKVVGEERMEFLTEPARTPIYNKVGFYGHNFVELLSKMQDAGFKLNSVRQFTDELEKPELDVLFVSRE
tara:strand:- start:2777 stop:3136 length:360 start_codon:yes stop_codon:yes gene_type:complete